MEKNLMENIEKIPMYKNKVEKIYSAISNKNNLKEAYIAIVAMIESVLTVLLKKVYNEDIKTTHLATISKLLTKHKENMLSEEAIYINSNREDDEYMEDIDEMDIEYLTERLDNILKIILEKHGNIFEK